MSTDISLEVRGLSKRFGETQALLNVDISFKPGTFHTIFGENGSGKSTLVKIIAGIIIPDSGTMKVGNQVVTRYHPRAMKALGIMSVMQEVLVAPNRSILENIFIGYDGLFRRNIAPADRTPLAREVLGQITHTAFDLDRLVNDIPLPQQQLVVIARALVNRPNILLLDEATAALDLDDRKMLFDALRKFSQEGKMILYISHRMDEVLELSDEVTVLRSGIKVDTLPREAVSSDKLLHLVQPPEVLAEDRHD